MPPPERAEAFEWDDDGLETGNTAHLARHAINADEAEQVFHNGGVLSLNKRHSGDWKLVGTTDGGRRLTLIFNYDDERRTIRFFTGWNSTTGERSKYS